MIDEFDILAVDPGQATGILVSHYSSGKVTHKKELTVRFGTSMYTLASFFRDIEKIFQENNIKAVIHGTPIQYRQVIAYQSKIIGVLELAAELSGADVWPLIDNQCKKAVMGHGSTTKVDIMRKYLCDDEHIADCHMFVDYFIGRMKKS